MLAPKPGALTFGELPRALAGGGDRRMPCDRSIVDLQRFSVADLPLLQTIGYGEALQIHDGSITRQSAIATTCQRTRQFAKRQRTWFRRQHTPQWLSEQDLLTEAMTLIEQHLG